jgi:hypothetical protein
MSKERKSTSGSLAAFCVRAISFLGTVAATVFVLFVNPINWKLYAEFTRWDWIWLGASDVAIVLAFGFGWWIGQRKLTRLIDRKKDA